MDHVDAWHWSPQRDFRIGGEKDINARPPKSPWQLDLVPPEAVTLGDGDNLHRASGLRELHSVVLMAKDCVAVSTGEADHIFQQVENTSSHARKLIGKEVAAINANLQTLNHLSHHPVPEERKADRVCSFILARPLIRCQLSL